MLTKRKKKKNTSKQQSRFARMTEGIFALLRNAYLARDSPLISEKERVTERRLL